MNILVISHMYPSAKNPTYGLFVHQQVKALQKQGCAVKVISPVPLAPWPLTLIRKKWRDYAAIPRQDSIEGVDVYYPRYLEFPRSYLLEHSGFWMYRGIRKLVKTICQEFKPDLLHAHVALPDGHAASLLREGKTPLLVTIHGQDFQSTIHKGKKCRQKLFQVLNSADKIITVSTKLKNIVEAEEFYPKIDVVNNGIDLSLCQSELKAEQSSEILDETKMLDKRIVSVSNLKKTKGIDLNLQALASLIQRYPTLHYTIVGDGEERANLEKLTDELGLRGQVTFLGKLSHSEALREMAQADIFSLPSWQEGFGVVYIEAMAQGIPVIGVKGEGIEDVIISGQNGLLVEPQNIAELAKAIDKLLGDEIYAQKLAKNGQTTIRQTSSWEHNAQKIMTIYEELVEHFRHYDELSVKK